MLEYDIRTLPLCPYKLFDSMCPPLANLVGLLIFTWLGLFRLTFGEQFFHRIQHLQVKQIGYRQRSSVGFEFDQLYVRLACSDQSIEEKPRLLEARGALLKVKEQRVLDKSWKLEEPSGTIDQKPLSLAVSPLTGGDFHHELSLPCWKLLLTGKVSLVLSVCNLTSIFSQYEATKESIGTER